MRCRPLIRAVAFDLDQTLCPREQAFWRWIDAECAAQPAHTLGRERVAELDAGGRGPKPVLLAYLAEALVWPESDFVAQHARFVEGCVRALTPDRALRALLARLQERYPLALVSNGTSRAQRAKLDKLGLGALFEPVLISEEVGCKKPARAIFERLVAAWGLPAVAIAFVGDHVEHDVLAARAAGLTPVWISDGRTWPSPEPEPLCISSVFELEALLELAQSGSAHSSAGQC